MNPRIPLAGLIMLFVTAPTIAIATQNNNNEICIYYFYGNGCPVCAETDVILADLEARYQITIHRFEVYNNMSNRELLIQFFNQ
ncbi:MAG: hypothetical protein ACTSW4_07365, partial [Candidatus Ranarchaeia archaeon]